MEVDISLISADRDRVFADWGVAVVLRSVVQTYDPEGGVIDESTTDYGVTAVIGESERESARGTAGQHAQVDTDFLMRTEDVPPGVELRTSRVVHNGVEHRVMSTETDAAGSTIQLRCRAI